MHIKFSTTLDHYTEVGHYNVLVYAAGFPALVPSLRPG